MHDNNNAFYISLPPVYITLCMLNKQAFFFLCKKKNLLNLLDTRTHHHNNQHSIVSLEYVHEMTVCLQSKLNCEVLDDTLAFELRWAVAGDSIVVQLVGKLGEYIISSCRIREFHNWVNRKFCSVLIRISPYSCLTALH